MQGLIEGANHWLNYHHLYYFKVIATEGGIAKAAQKLKLGQPTLSAQLKIFEESLNVRLFDRQHKKLVLTETGRVVLDYANEIFKMGGEMIEVISDRRVPDRIDVKIGALDSVPKHLILKLASTAYSYGNCSVSILEGKSDELIQELSSHRIDLFLSNFVPPSGEIPGLYSRRISRSPVIVCGAAKYRGLKKGFPRSLDGKPFVLPTSHSKTRQDLEHAFRMAGIQMDIVAETQDSIVQKLMGIQGIGLVPSTMPAVGDYLKDKSLFEIGTLSSIHEDIFLIAASRKIENPISSKLMKNFMPERAG